MSSVHPTRLRRQKPIDKAAKLIIEGRVHLTDARVYLVDGDHHTYQVVVDQGGIFCPCEAHTPLCSHVLAAAIAEQHRRATAEAIGAGS